MRDERKYISFLSSSVRNFKYKGNDVWNFSCPICGDSKKSSSKARGYILGNNGKFRVYCHNCGYNKNFSHFLKEIDPASYDSMIMESFHNSKECKQKNKYNKQIEKDEIKSVDMRLIDKLMDRIDHLPFDHEAKRYVKKRGIPDKFWNSLYFIDDISKIEQLSPKYKDRIKGKEPRLIIPFFDKDHKLFALTARAIRDEYLKYVTIRIDETKELIFGLDRIDLNKQIYVVEGPIDSMFLPNSVAIGSSDLKKAAKHLPTDRSTFILDNQPRNRDIVRIARGCANKGFSLFVWPEGYHEKDINDLVDSGYKDTEIVDLINENTFSGLELSLELGRWCKI